MPNVPFLSLFDGNTIWYLAGASVLLTSLIVGLRALQQSARRRRVLGARAATIADARDGELVVVRGRAKNTPMVRAPITGRDVIWTRIIVRGEVARPGILSFSTLHREVRAQTLALEDGTGRVEVGLEGALVTVGPERVDKSYTPQDDPLAPRLLPFFDQHTELTKVVSAGKAQVALRTFEEIILPEDEISVVGIAKRGGPNGTGQLQIAPSSDGLYVIHGDLRALAASGALWKDAPDV